MQRVYLVNRALAQVYTAFAYDGPKLVPNIKGARDFVRCSRKPLMRTPLAQPS
jgi:hypothetical protein